MPVSTLLDHVVSQRQKLESCYRPTDPSAGKLSAVVSWLCAINTRRFYQLLNGIPSSKCTRILYADHIEQFGKRFFEEICGRDLEGIVAKRKLSIYKNDGIGWIKIKNRTYSQAEGRHELLTRTR